LLAPVFLRYDVTRLELQFAVRLEQQVLGERHARGQRVLSRTISIDHRPMVRSVAPIDRARHYSLSMAGRSSRPRHKEQSE
jgi:hypothetical protein